MSKVHSPPKPVSPNNPHHKQISPEKTESIRKALERISNNQSPKQTTKKENVKHKTPQIKEGAKKDETPKTEQPKSKKRSFKTPNQRVKKQNDSSKVTPRDLPEQFVPVNKSKTPQTTRSKIPNFHLKDNQTENEQTDLIVDYVLYKQIFPQLPIKVLYQIKSEKKAPSKQRKTTTNSTPISKPKPEPKTEATPIQKEEDLFDTSMDKIDLNSPIPISKLQSTRMPTPPLPKKKPLGDQLISNKIDHHSKSSSSGIGLYQYSHKNADDETKSTIISQVFTNDYSQSNSSDTEPKISMLESEVSDCDSLLAFEIISCFEVDDFQNTFICQKKKNDSDDIVDIDPIDCDMNILVNKQFNILKQREFFTTDDELNYQSEQVVHDYYAETGKLLDKSIIFLGNTIPQDEE